MTRDEVPRDTCNFSITPADSAADKQDEDYPTDQRAIECADHFEALEELMLRAKGVWHAMGASGQVRGSDEGRETTTL